MSDFPTGSVGEMIVWLIGVFIIMLVASFGVEALLYLITCIPQVLSMVMIKWISLKNGKRKPKRLSLNTKKEIVVTKYIRKIAYASDVNMR